MVDSLDIVREWLIVEGTTLFTAIGDADTPDNSRVWKDSLHPVWLNTSLAALVISLEDEDDEANGAVHKPILSVNAYPASSDSDDARALYGLVWDRLQHKSGPTSVGNLDQATQASALGITTDPNAKGHILHRSRWNLRTEEA